MTHAVVLAAGNGDRFRGPAGSHKLLHPFLGRPLLLRTIEAARDAGVSDITLVLGYQAASVRALVEDAGIADVRISYVVNENWELENGVSVMAARRRASAARFALLMGDHIFDPAVLRRLWEAPVSAGESILAVDTTFADPSVIDEATKVRLDGTRIVAIGKDLAEFDALDTGMFVCTPALFDALQAAQSQGDTTLSGGIRELAARGMMRAFDTGGAGWCDIDTVADLEVAEAALAAVRVPVAR